jgi:hypothetical protein
VGSMMLIAKKTSDFYGISRQCTRRSLHRVVASRKA